MQNRDTLSSTRLQFEDYKFLYLGPLLVLLLYEPEELGHTKTGYGLSGWGSSIRNEPG
jgi:hypothetical protein